MFVYPFAPCVGFRAIIGVYPLPLPWVSVALLVGYHWDLVVEFGCFIYRVLVACP